MIFVIILLFSIVWFFIWLWFFKDDKASSEVVYKSAFQAFDEGHYEKVKALLSKVSELSPEAKNKLGVALLKLGEYDEAKTCFEQILKNSPKNSSALFNLAQALQFKGDSEKALETYSKIIAEDDKNLEGYLNIAQINYQKGNYAEALDVLNKAKELAPENVQVLFSIAKCKNELSDTENDDECKNLIAEYTNLEGNKDLPKDFNISLAKLYAKSGQIDKAMQQCKNALIVNEEDIEAHRLLGLIQLIKKDFTGAKNSLSVALNFQPKNIETHNIFSYLLCNQSDSCAMKKCREKYYELIEKHLK